MALLGTLLKNKRAGETGLAWNRPALAGPGTLELSSPEFEHERRLALSHAGRRVGGEDRSPALGWSAVPTGTAQLLLVIEDVDSPTKSPIVHCVALLEPGLVALPADALRADAPAAGVRVLRAEIGRGYRGPGPIKGHGPHRYVFQLFALAAPVAPAAGGGDLESARPRALLAAIAGPVLARGRLDGFYTR